MRHIHIRLDSDIYDAVKYQAMEKEQTVSETIRVTVKNYMKQLAAEEGLEATTAVVRAEVIEALETLDNRLTKILTKAITASATNMYLSIQCIGGAYKRDAEETHVLAQAKAAQYLRAAEE